MPLKLAVFVPFLNEESHLPAFLASVASQTRRPDHLILIDDGSADGSVTIAEAFVRENTYASLARRPRRPPSRDRLATAPEFAAFLWAVSEFREPWDVAAKVDADLEFTPLTLATIEQEFLDDELLGLTGAFLSVETPGGRRRRERCPPHHVRGATKFYRRACYEALQPLPVFPGWESVDETKARMLGWRARSIEIPSGDPLHLRPVGAHDGALRAHRRWGRCAYSAGDDPLNVIAVAGQRVLDRPPVLGSLNYLAGWTMAAMTRIPRADAAVRAFTRREQRARIKGRLRAMVRRGHPPAVPDD